MIKNSLIISLLTAITIGGLLIQAKHDFELTFLNFSCSANDQSPYVSTLSCGLSKNAKRRTLSMAMTFAKDINAFHLNMLILMPRSGDSDFILLNLTKMDGCHMLSNKNQVTLMNLGRSQLDRYSNFPKQCPFRKQVPYYIRGFRMEMELLPVFRFETEMKVFFEYLSERQSMLDGYIHARFGLKSKTTRGRR